MRILIVPDKFKGTLSAKETCGAIASGWRSARPADELEWLPMSDGGDGFGAVLAELTQAKTRTVNTVDAAHRPLAANWWWERRQRLAIVESAQIIGLAMLPEKRFHPYRLDTFGLGRVLQAAARAGARGSLIGIGGSATNDGGFGLARALGWKFLDPQGRELDQWWQLHRLARAVRPRRRLKLRMTVAVDVANPLLGTQGCSRIFGPQKGLTRPGDALYAEACLGRLNHVLKQQYGLDCARLSGAGAAGGLGFGLAAFAGAQLRAGFEVFAQAAGLDRRIAQSDLVITGEGSIDQQTFMGKGVGQIGRLCRKLRVPCAVLAGRRLGPRPQKLFWSVKALTDLTDVSTAQKQPRRYLGRLAAALARWAERNLDIAA